MLRITTPTRECAARMRRVASMPSMFGIARSITTTSGATASANRTLSRPSAASATPVISDSRSSRARRPSRTTVWSSANKIRIAFMSVPLAEFGHRQCRVNQGPSPWLGTNLEAPSHTAYPLLHSQQAKAAHETRIETRPVILHGYVHLLALLSHRHFDGARVGVADCIVHGFLYHAVDARPVLVRQAVDSIVGGDHYVQSCALTGFTRMPVQRRRQTEVIEHRRPQQECKISHLVDCLFRKPLDRIEVLADFGGPIRPFGAFPVHQDRRQNCPASP